MDWSIKSRPEKEAIRQRAFKGYHQSAGAIILPGWDETSGEAGRCIRAALDVSSYASDQVSIDLSKPLYCVERDSSLFPLIENDIRELGFSDARFHNGEIDTLAIDTPIDFAFIDLCGTVSPSILRWLRDVVRPNLLDGSHLGFTMLKSARGSDFILAAFYTMMRHYHDVYDEIKNTWWINKPQVIVPLFLLRCALEGMDFATEITEYRDTTGMLFMRFTGAYQVDLDWPDLEDVLNRASKVEEARRGTNIPTLKSVIIDLVKKRTVVTNADIHTRVQEIFGTSYTINQIAFALVELQSETGNRRLPGGGVLVKIASKPNTYTSRQHFLSLAK